MNSHNNSEEIALSSPPNPGLPPPLDSRPPISDQGLPPPDRPPINERGLPPPGKPPADGSGLTPPPLVSDKPSASGQKLSPPPSQLGKPPLNSNGPELPPPPPLSQLGRPPLEDGSPPPPHPPERLALPNVWIYDGEAYDLTDFIAKHPGGQFFIGRTKNRDITAIVNVFHPNPAKVKKVIQKYSLQRSAEPDDIHPKYNAPPFLFKEDFNGWRDTPKYSFNGSDQLLNKIRARVNEPAFKAQIAQQDLIFNIVGIVLFVLYLVWQWLYLDQHISIYLFVPLIVALRISLAGVGHYLIHRPQVGINKALSSVFDINYVPLALVVTDGHTLLHHPYTQSPVDIKRNVFTAMLELPRYYRLPVHSLHKIGHVVSGTFIRIVDLCILTFKTGTKDIYGSWQLGLPHFIGSFAIHVLLLGELVLFTLKGDWLAWLVQFFITLWLSTFMIVASHDFEQQEIVGNMEGSDGAQDWALLQIKNSYDLTMVGNKYIDCFLSAGLSPHRVHHVLPQQKSGFANILSESIVREEAEKVGVEWLPPKNFFLERLPVLANLYLAVPSRFAHENDFGLIKEHLHPKALMETADYLVKGWTGVGSI
jgi:Cytochrome b5-like Heme/Steroid binding domain